MAQQIVRQHELRSDTPKAAIYARVSTLNGQNPDVQTREIEEYCQRRGFEIFSVYVDKGVSGKKDSRPQLNRMMEDAHQGRFDVIVVARFDRFARSVSHLLRALETFNALGIQFVSLAEQVDTSTPTGKMIFTVLGAVSELERNLIVERVHSGLRHARAKGKRLGRPRKTVDAVRIAALRKNGNSWRTIAREMKLSVGTVFGANQDLPEPALYEPQISDEFFELKLQQKCVFQQTAMAFREFSLSQLSREDLAEGYTAIHPTRCE